MSIVKDPVILYSALIKIRDKIKNSNCPNNFASRIASEAIRTYDGIDPNTAEASGVVSVTSVRLAVIKPGPKTDPLNNETSYLLYIPFKRKKIYRLLTVRFYNNHIVSGLILETPDTHLTHTIKSDIKEKGLKRFLKSYDSYRHWYLNEVDRTEIMLGFNPKEPVLSIRESNLGLIDPTGYIIKPY